VAADARQLAAEFRFQAEAKEAAAKGYNRKCTTRKGMQCLIEARVLRDCADRAEKLSDQAGKPDQAATANDTSQGVADERAHAEADNRPSTSGTQQEDQAT